VAAKPPNEGRFQKRIAKTSPSRGMRKQTNNKKRGAAAGASRFSDFIGKKSAENNAEEGCNK